MISYQIDDKKNMVQPSGITIVKKTFELTPVADTFTNGFDVSCDNAEELINILVNKDVIVAYNEFVNRNIIINSNNYVDTDNSPKIFMTDRIMYLSNRTDTEELYYRFNNWNNLSESEQGSYKAIYQLLLLTKAPIPFEVYYVE